VSIPIELLQVEALKLTAEERARLADRLIASLFEDDVESAWAEEVDRRIAAIESGESRVVPSSEAIARARDALM